MRKKFLVLVILSAVTIPLSVDATGGGGGWRGVNTFFRSIQADIQQIAANTRAANEQLTAIDGILEELSSAKPSDQLVCELFSPWLLDGTPFPCVQATMPGARPNYSLEELLADGWTIKEVGPANTNRIFVTFFK